MIRDSEVERKIKDMHWDVWAIAEWGLQLEEELLEKIEELEEELEKEINKN